VDAKTWAILTGDPDILAKIAADRKKGRTLGWTLIGGGGIVAASSIIPLFFVEDALGVNESTPGFDEIGRRNDIRVATSFSLLGAGALLAASGVASHAVADHRALVLSRHLDAAAADAGIAAYNARLSSVLAVAAPTAEPTDAEDDGTESATAPPVDAPPAVATPAPSAQPTSGAAAAGVPTPGASTTGTAGAPPTPK
jgi:hypothetical protein